MNVFVDLKDSSSSKSDITKDIENCTVCFFDLDTTGLSEDFENVQVSAGDFDGLM